MKPWSGLGFRKKPDLAYLIQNQHLSCKPPFLCAKSPQRHIFSVVQAQYGVGSTFLFYFLAGNLPDYFHYQRLIFHCRNPCFSVKLLSI
jgi:hypothetical protein